MGIGIVCGKPSYGSIRVVSRYVLLPLSLGFRRLSRKLDRCILLMAYSLSFRLRRVISFHRLRLPHRQGDKLPLRTIRVRRDHCDLENLDSKYADCAVLRIAMGTRGMRLHEAA